MYSAPAVSYPVGRSRFEGVLIALITVVGAIVVSGWLVQSQDLGLRHVAGLCFWLASTSLAVWHWVRAPLGSLAWNGKCWTWACGAISETVEPAVIFDLQQVLLLQFKIGDGASLWIWPERQTDALHWLALRRAVFNQGLERSQ
jgi:hypothetical protein